MNNLANPQSASVVLKQIVDMQFSGEVQAAHDAYVEFFQLHEADCNALNLFGLCCVSLGKFEKAERIFEHILSESPQISETNVHLANCRFEQGKMKLALEALKMADPKDLGTVEIQIVLARIQMALGQHEQARVALKTALSLEPRKVEICLAMAGIQKELGDTKDAMTLYKKVLFDDPQNYGALIGQAEIYFDRKQWETVLINTGAVLEQFPNDLRAGQLHSRSLERLGRIEDMLETALNMAVSAPDDIDVLVTLCNAHHKSENYPSCIFVADHALAIDPKVKALMTLRASSYFRLGFNEIALQQINEVLSLYPDDTFALQNKGVILERLCRLDEAIAIYDQILERKPDEKTIKFNKSFCLLLKGELKAGFELYESRFNRESALLPNYLGDEPVWAGENIEGKHLLIHPEQGFGDTIMACRFVKFLKDTGASITFAVPSALKGIIQTLDAEVDVVSVGEQVPRIDFHVPLMSLAHLTGRLWDEIPAETQYLRAPPDAQAKWNERLGDSQAFRVGFVCSGNPKHTNDAARSINMSSFLNALPAGPEYHLLQKDLRGTDLVAVSRRTDIVTHQDDLHDFSDTAALCVKMDLVVSVDTSVAHLAGALGLPTIVMLSAWPDWRWGLEQAQDKWYPNTRLVRQSKLNEWQDVLSSVSFLITRKMDERDIV